MKQQWMINLSLLSAVVSMDALADWYLEPQVTTSAATRLHGSDRLVSQENRLGIKAEQSTDNWTVNIEAWLEYDSANFTEAEREEYEQRFWLDEAYISGFWQEIEWSLGYQKIVWGQADDLRVLDVINPLDLKDFVLFDLDEYRLSLPILKAEHSTSFGDYDWDFEWLIILDSKPNRLPPAGSEFDLGLPEVFDHDRPTGPEFGFRAQSFIAGADIALHLFHGDQDQPLLQLPDTTAFPRLYYDQETLIGLALSKPVTDLVVRSELAWFFNRQYLDTQLVSHSGQTGQLLLGIDYLSGDWLWTAQFTDRWIEHWQNDYLEPEHDAIVTLSTDATLWAGQLALRFAISFAESHGGGALYQSKLTYTPTPQWKLQLNLDVLSGEQNNFFGQFTEQDRIWTAISYLF